MTFVKPADRFCSLCGLCISYLSRRTFIIFDSEDEVFIEFQVGNLNFNLRMNKKNTINSIEATFGIKKGSINMFTLIKKIALIALLCYCMAVLTSCNTVHGFGKDIEVLGAKMQKKSSDKK